MPGCNLMPVQFSAQPAVSRLVFIRPWDFGVGCELLVMVVGTRAAHTAAALLLFYVCGFGLRGEGFPAGLVACLCLCLLCDVPGMQSTDAVQSIMSGACRLSLYNSCSFCVFTRWDFFFFHVLPFFYVAREHVAPRFPKGWATFCFARSERFVCSDDCE